MAFRGKRTTLAALAMLGLVAAGLVGYYATTIGGRSVVGGAEADEGFDVTDERLLVGFAENVFVGRVVDRVASAEMKVSGPDPGPPVTLFAVEVQQNIKGELPVGEKVTVGQMGGYSKADSAVQLYGDDMENPDPLLEPGQEVLFVTRPSGSGDWLQITTSGYGDVRIKDKEERRKLVEKFKKAKEKQIDPANPPQRVTPRDEEGF